MARADEARRLRHGRKTFFVHSLNLNPTNVCRNRCKLCAFWREPDAPDAYVMSLDQVRRHLIAAKDWNLTDLHVVGGLHEKLDLRYHEELLRLARELLPAALIQGITAVEIAHLARQENLSVATVLERLRDAGLGAISGGGAEIFAPQVRSQICADKISADEWLSVHEQAHALGLPTNATMLFGHLEQPEDIIDHLDRLRQLQDRTGGFQAFVALPFHPAGTQLAAQSGPGGDAVARTVALARLYLDNFPHVRVLANYVDRKLLAVLPHGGADDLGGTSLDERIARAAGAPANRPLAAIEEMTAFIRELGLEPVLVNSIYEKCATVGLSDRANDGRQSTRSDKPTVAQAGELSKALAAAESGRRLSTDEAIVLHDEAPLAQLGLLAHHRRMAAVPERRVTFVLDRNISITNICQAGCRFCAFHVAPGAPGGFVLSVEEIVEKVLEAQKLGATQIMLQGGLNPDLDLAFYERMLSAIKARAADVWLHSLSPAEVLFLAQQAGLSIRQCLERLRAAGLDSLPGGGAEILVEEVRREVSPHKISAAHWLEVMETAQALGLKTTATLVYGLGETTAQRVEHLLRIRELQDRTGGFTAFIPWSFQPNRTKLKQRPATGADYLRIVALARLVLDNVTHLQAGWVTEGPELAQLALSFGADDWGGVLMEEQVVRATGVAYAVTPEQVVNLILQTGRTAAQRTTLYEICDCGKK
jgi:dehypoxanthine futalosine cyclase